LDAEKISVVLEEISQALKRIAVVLENIFEKDSFSGKGHINLKIVIEEKRDNGK